MRLLKKPCPGLVAEPSGSRLLRASLWSLIALVSGRAGRGLLPEEDDHDGAEHERRGPGERPTTVPHRLMDQGPREPEGGMAPDRRGVGPRRRQGFQPRAGPAAPGRPDFTAGARG